MNLNSIISLKKQKITFKNPKNNLNQRRAYHHVNDNVRKNIQKNEIYFPLVKHFGKSGNSNKFTMLLELKNK